MKIVVVDDYEPIRSFLVRLLRARPGLIVIGEALNGLEAVQKAHELRPDLILMDIGLPILNGIEAARRIHKASPSSKILFVSDNRCSEIAEEALRAGGLGYVVKSDIHLDLLPAIDAIARGELFLSASLTNLQLEAHLLSTTGWSQSRNRTRRSKPGMD
jgi:DNA-binding NarL/FixJ family response regulator